MFSPASAARARTTTAKSNIQRLRHIYQPRLCHVLAMQPRFAPNTDEDSARLALEQLTAQLRSRRWTLASDGEAIERSFKFKTFAKTWVSRSSASTGSLRLDCPISPLTPPPGLHDRCITTVQNQTPPSGMVKRGFRLPI